LILNSVAAHNVLDVVRLHFSACDAGAPVTAYVRQ
jgi:hypothetical protein